MTDTFFKKIIFRVKNYRYELLVVATLCVVFLSRSFTASSDAASSWFAPAYNLNNLFSSWATYGGLGDYAPQNFTSFFLRLFYSVFEVFSSDPRIIQYLAWSSFFIFFGLILFKYIKEYTNNPLGAYFAVLFCFFNPVAQLFLWGKQHWAYYLVIPYLFCTFWYTKMLQTRELKYGLYISLLWFLFGFAFNQPAYIASFFIISAVVFLFYFFQTNNRVELFLLNINFLLLFILINTIYLIPLFLGGNEKLSFAIENFAFGDSLPILRELASINFLLSFFNTALNFETIFTGVWFLAIWLIFFVLIFYYGLYKKDSKNRFEFLYLCTLLLIFIFFAKGISNPFGSFSEILFDNRLMYIFRDFKDKFAIGYATIISLLYILLIKNSNIISKLYLYGLSAVCLFLFINNVWLPVNFRYSDSLNYIQPITIINKQDTTRVLNLPLVDYSFFYTSNPDYVGDNPLKNLLKADVIYGTEFKNNKRTVELKSALTTQQLLEEDLKNYLKDHHIRYVLNHKNSYVKEDENPLQYDYQYLSKFNSLKLVEDTDKFQVFEFTETNGLIYSDNTAITYTKINNSTYAVKIEELNNISDLNFLSRYHAGWSLLFLPTGTYQPNCDLWSEQYINSSTQCAGRVSLFQKVFPAGKIIFQNIKTGSQEDNRKNTWTITSSDIRDRLPSNFWDSADDGTITIEGIIYFEPQRVFNVSLIVSVILLLSIISFWFYFRKSS